MNESKRVGAWTQKQIHSKYFSCWFETVELQKHQTKRLWRKIDLLKNCAKFAGSFGGITGMTTVFSFLHETKKI